MAVLLLIVSLYAAFGSKLEAQAASSKEEYESVEDILTERVGKKVDAGKVVKKGNYYFKYETEEYTDSDGDTSTRKIYYVSEYKDKEFRELDSSDLCTNGKNAYYVSGKYLYSYNLKTGEANKLKKVPKVSDSGFYYAGSIGGGYGNVLLIQIWQGEGTADLYSYNIKTKKFTKQKKESYCKGGKGKYFVSCDNCSDSIGTLTLWKITSTGIKKVTTLTKYGAVGLSDCQCAYVTSKYVYYTEYANGDGGNLSIYRCKLNGTGKKKIMTKKIKFTDEAGEWVVYIGTYKITSKYCIYESPKNGKLYKYTYKTKKATRYKD